jgi:hypothetical protein
MTVFTVPDEGIYQYESLNGDGAKCFLAADCRNVCVQLVDRGGVADYSWCSDPRLLR